MTESEVIAEIRARVKKAGSLRALAREWHVTPSYLSDLLNGRQVAQMRQMFPGVVVEVREKATESTVSSNMEQVA